jgi:Protein of unknown function (DUF998)
MNATGVWAMRGLAIGCVVIVAVLHVLRPDVSPFERGISRYASGPTLPLMTLAFLALAGAIGIAAWTTGSWLLGIAAIAQAGVAAFPDANIPPARSIPHTVLGFVFFVTVAAGLYTSNRSSSVLAWLPVVALLLFFASIAGVPGLARAPGLMQRVCFIAIVASLIGLTSGH